MIQRWLGAMALGFGFLLTVRPTTMRAQQQPSAFEVASIRETDPKFNGWKLEFTVNGLTARGVTLQMLVEEAYAIWEDDRIAGLPPWAKEERFDIAAKQGTSDKATLQEMPLEERRKMLQRLLAERFGVKLHRDSQQKPVFLLIADKQGSKLVKTQFAEVTRGDVKGIQCLVRRSDSTSFQAESCTATDLAFMLQGRVGRTVVNETGLSGAYDFELHWDAAANSDAPSLFTAVREQLGLRLVPAKRPVDVVVVDHAEEPSAN